MEVYLVYQYVWDYSKSSYGQTSDDWRGSSEKKTIKWNGSISFEELFRRYGGDFAHGKGWDEEDKNHRVEIKSILLKGMGGEIEVPITEKIIKLPL